MTPAPPPPITAPPLLVERLGRVGYEDALALQRRAADALRAGRGPELLLLLEHPPVVTLGRRARTDGNLLLSREQFAARGITVVATDRGGDVTFHGPGQLVGYPILDLRARRLGVREYLHWIEERLIRVLARLGVEAFRDAEHVGVWTAQGKVAALGVRVSGGVSLHGFALNVNTDLDAFGLIVPCGIRGRAVASLHRLLGREVDLEAVADLVAEEFGA